MKIKVEKEDLTQRQQAHQQRFPFVVCTYPTCEAHKGYPAFEIDVNNACPFCRGMGKLEQMWYRSEDDRQVQEAEEEARQGQTQT